MNFNSWQFLVFLPLVVLLYWVLPHKARWAMLLIASYIFYMSWNVWLIVLIMITTITAYGFAIGIERTQNIKLKKLFLAITLIICLGLLISFKYINFILESAIGVIRLFGGAPDDIVLNIILPVGISFYTFQTLSYVVEVYWGKFKAERHFGYFALYVAYFPQLVAGPIEKPQTLLPQLRQEQKFNEEDLLEGGKWLLSGFFRKCVVADFCGIFVNKVYSDLGGSSGLAVFIASGLFLIQIYNDFAGYSEIALGAARLMGVKLSKNFDKPLTSTSYTEFFRRWHITLNQWFTQYVYIPLGGNRKGTARKILNTLIVFALCGLWHGANWTFVIWGVVAGVMISLETLLRKPFAKLCEKAKIDPENPAIKLLRQSLIFLLFTLNGVLFRAQNLAEVGLAFRQMFTSWDTLENTMSDLGINALQIIQLAIFITAMVMVYKLPQSGSAGNEKPLPLSCAATAADNISVFIYGIIAVMLCWLGLIAMGDSSAFQYFQF